MKEERFPRTRKPLRGRRLRVAEGGSFGATEESAATEVRRAKRRGSRTEAGRRAALTSPRGLSAHPPGRAGLGAEARASVLARRESGKKSAAAEEARDFSSLCVYWCARRGDSERHLNELQRWARAAAISADPTATGVQRAKQRDSRTEARHRAAPTKIGRASCRERV